VDGFLVVLTIVRSTLMRDAEYSDEYGTVVNTDENDCYATIVRSKVIRAVVYIDEYRTVARTDETHFYAPQ
jgi:hypothetical protein